MEAHAKRKVALGVAAGLLLVGGGGAFAASKLMTPQQQSQAVINDAANRLGIEPSKLSAALKQALEDRVDAAVASGQITKAQGDKFKAAIESGDVPLIFAGHPGGGPGGRFGFGFRHPGFGDKLDAAATAIGITEAQLQTELQSGKTLAQIAKDHGKTADDVVNALVADAQKKLDAAVKAGKLTQSQADAMLSDLKSHITDMVNGTAPKGPWGHYDGDHDGDHGGMPGFRQYRQFRGSGNGAFTGPPPAPQGAVGAPVNIA
jgi:polyhydroxyalkanoate synthesis regulator phasin